MMRMSTAGLKALRIREGCVLHAYKDSVGVPTIGVGHTGRASPPQVRIGDVITQEQADSYLASDLAPFEAALNRAVTRPLTQNQVDACLSLAFNIGEHGFIGSSVVHHINAGDVSGAADAFLMWSHPPELAARRRAERSQFLRSDATIATGLPAVKPPAPPHDLAPVPKPLSAKMSWLDRIRERLGFLALACAVLLVAGPALAGSPYTNAAEASPNAALWAQVTAILMQGVVAIVGLLVALVVVKARQWFGLQITATQEETVRQALLTGAHDAIVAGEGAADRAQVVERATAWAKQREAATISKLGWSDQVLAKVAVKMVASAAATAVQPATKG